MAGPETIAGLPRRPGRRLSVELANTVDWRLSDSPIDSLQRFEDIATWGREMGIFDADDARSLKASAEADAKVAKRDFDRMIALRESLHRIYSRVADRSEAPEEDLHVLNREMCRVFSRSRLRSEPGMFAWSPRHDESPFERMLWLVVHDAVNLLTSRLHKRIGKCGGEGCAWIFLDMSRNRSRQWCSMESCGNRAKARRHYERTRSAAHPPD